MRDFKLYTPRRGWRPTIECSNDGGESWEPTSLIRCRKRCGNWMADGLRNGDFDQIVSTDGMTLFRRRA